MTDKRRSRHGLPTATSKGRLYRKRGVTTLSVLVAGVLLASPLVGAAPAAGRTVTRAACKGGMAGIYPCKGVDLQSYVTREDLQGAGVADVWGWADPETGKEYALLGSRLGVLFLDVSNPSQPIYLGNLVPKPSDFIWQELEVYEDHVFAVCDVAPCGLQIFDLTRLRGAESVQRWTPDVIYPLPNVHTIDLNPDTGMLYANGMLFPVGGPQMVLDVTIPKAPILVGAVADDGYTHDSLCRIYRGPDKNFSGGEVCFNFNEDTITIYDMTNKLLPTQLARVTYDNATYIHSGALTQDHAYLLSTDEGDEWRHGLRSTTYIWDVRKLTKPKLVNMYTAKSGATDHNLYTYGDAVFHASYTAGLRILDASKVAQGKLREVAFFDIMPESDEPKYSGSWAAYPYLPSGNVLVGGMGQGLFIVKPDPTILGRLGR